MSLITRPAGGAIAHGTPNVASDHAPDDAGASQSDGKELTRSRLLRFGAIIAVMILSVLVIAVYALRSSAGDITATRNAGSAIEAVAETKNDALMVNRSRFARSMALDSGDATLVARFTTDGTEAVAELKSDLAEAVEFASATPVDGLSAADTEALGAVGVAGTAVIALQDKAAAFLEASNGYWTEDALVLQAATYDDSVIKFNELRTAQDELIALLDKSKEATKAASTSNASRNQMLAAAAALAALAAFVVIGRRVIKSVGEAQVLKTEAAAAQVRERDQAAESQVAADELQRKVDSMLTTLSAAAAGDLTSRVEVSGTDAVGRMGEALSKLLTDLRASISSIAGNSDTLAAAAEELQVVSGQMGVNSAETSKQVTLVTSASIEVTRNVETVAAGAEEMAASIKEIARNTSAAAKVAAEAVEAARVTNDTVTRLGESSAEIDQIVKVITGIAQQTNLLALNATIEAARAGEAGKGFAVVANEVKELAKETAKATEDISARIETIQTETRMSVESITGIVSIIDQIAEFQNTIASAVEQQAATTSEMARSVSDASGGSAEIAANMQNVSSAADSTASGASDSQGAASELARMASELKTLVGQFTY